MRIFALIAFMLFVLASCAGTGNRAFFTPEPTGYISPPDRPEHSANSLWSDTDGTYVEEAGLYGDIKARGLNDLVTIKIVENASASKKAETVTSRDSSLDAGVDEFFGSPLDFGLTNLWGMDRPFSPNVAGSMGSDFSGSGKTTRAGTLAATITARVVEVLPNGNFVIESRKEITVNRERQILVLRGLIRPEDIESDNSILSTKVANAQVVFTGEGVIQDKQGQGWLVRIMDRVWPF
jgi:flagellar L-ring protein precursor FlgH